ncbi:MAG: hypothetical protein RL417_541 [Pseudomonadota bacterium]|jgi:acetoin utilization deacetylase AcuC-like enzyme
MTFLIVDNRAASAQHGSQPDGFEHHGRLLAALEGVDLSRDRTFESLSAPHAAAEHLELVHTTAYLDAVRKAVRDAAPSGSSFHDEVMLYPGSWDAAVSSAGGAIRAVEALLRREARYAFVATRSPGHHAEPEQARGFCILSNAALAARVAGLAGVRTAVLDIDIHNGNGTEKALAGKPDTLFTELFLEGHPRNSYPYPTDLAPAAVNALRIGLPTGTSGGAWVDAFELGIAPHLAAFRPDLIICSAGFDCMEGDPVGGFGVTPEDIFRITKRLKDLQTPILSLLEGGYRLDNLRLGVAAHVAALR